MSIFDFSAQSKPKIFILKILYMYGFQSIMQIISPPLVEIGLKQPFELCSPWYVEEANDLSLFI